VYSEKYQKSGKVPVNIPAVPNLDDEDQKDILLDFIHNSVITNPHTMERILPLHLCFHWIWRIFSQLISLPFNSLCCILVVQVGEEGMKNGK